ncbi:MAG: hypothetical protein ACKVRO_12640 [Micropepsaceae bacterium]
MARAQAEDYQDRRGKIVAKAAALFAEHGFHLDPAGPAKPTKIADLTVNTFIEGLRKGALP